MLSTGALSLLRRAVEAVRRTPRWQKRLLVVTIGYRHFGQFAPLGGEQTAAQLPGDWIHVGHSTQWLWYSVYASKQFSWRTRMLVVSDWGRRFIFGRDSSSL